MATVPTKKWMFCVESLKIFCNNKLSKSMCIIANRIISVKDTKLFCGTNADKTRQFIVYANNVNNPTLNNVMILPVWNPDTVEFHDLSGYKDLFENCNGCFENMMLGRGKMTLSNNSANCFGMGKGHLAVSTVGSFQASIAPTLADLNRADPNVFNITQDAKNCLAKNYANGFGFIICKLATGKKEYHPFAYSHKIDGGKVFIPTKHFHIHEMGPVSFMSRQFDNGLDENAYADDWEHEIYLYNVTSKSDPTVYGMDSHKWKWNETCRVNLNKIGFGLDKVCRNFEKLDIQGYKPNIDIVLACV
jgi:hypothetical protein